MSRQNCRMAAIQMVSGPRVADNLAVAGHLIADAVGQAPIDKVDERPFLGIEVTSCAPIK